MSRLVHFFKEHRSASLCFGTVEMHGVISGYAYCVLDLGPYIQNMLRLVLNDVFMLGFP